ncbi:MAG TPA: RluA family pseudouridine synthase [Candidatus Acidoferrales bacterium]|nr:RluA family pseudouridine synthase [Candidatus Acidoferrales bacterium]
MRESKSAGKIEKIRAGPQDVGVRLDRFLAERLPELSRTRVQELIREGRVIVGGHTARASQKIAEGETVEIEVIARPAFAAEPEAIPLEVLYEEADLAVINKPAGMVVHGGAGETHGTLVNALLHRYSTLSGEGGELRPGIVHRLDRGTSGVLVIARNDRAHRALAQQFEKRTTEKFYLALLHGKLAGNSGTITLPIARDLQRRTRMTTKRKSGREARTDWRVLLRLPGFTLVEARLHTGRTHQIRAHFAGIGHPVAGDTTYGAPREPRAGQHKIRELERTFLHAARIAFMRPASGQRVEVRAPLVPELREYLAEIAEASEIPAAQIDAALNPYL